MSKKPTYVNPAAPTKRRSTLLSLFTPLNILLLTLTLGGAVAVGLTQFEPAKPTQLPAALATPATTPTASTSTPKPATVPPHTDRFAIAPPPDTNALPATFEGGQVGTPLELFIHTPPTLGLAPAPAGARTPINAQDLFTSKPTNFQSPTIEYKGYKVGFCCAQSVGYNGGWEHLNEAQKDTYVRNFLK